MASETKATPSTSSLGNRLWGNGLYAVATVIYLVALGAVLFTLDQSYYTTRKMDVLGPRVVAQHLNPAQHQALKNAAVAFVTGQNSDDMEARNRTRLQLLDAMETLLANNPIVVAVSFSDVKESVKEEVSDYQRIRSQHDFSNSLLSRSFVRPLRQGIEGRNQNHWTLRIDYTTPKGDDDVEALTDHYGMMMLVSFLILSLLYYLILVAIFAPLRRVILYMRSRDDPGSSIIPHPKTLLERTYNDLARDATLTRMSKDLRDMISSRGLSYAEPVLEVVPELFSRFLGIKTCQVHTFSYGPGAKAWRHERSFVRETPSAEENDFADSLTQLLIENDPENPVFLSGRHIAKKDDAGKTLDFFCESLNQTSDYLWLLVIQSGKGKAQTGTWWLDFYSRAAQELRYAIGSIEDQRRLILQEKSKANISLSRNLGHDLTNIIATSKLELMTVRTFLALPPAEIAKSPAKEAIFKESLQALLNNTRFLQEIVNIYRSFSFLEKPKFEEVNVSELVADVVNLYKLSLSRTFSLETELSPDVPVLHIEPRLLRLALFNILNNASDAIKQAATPEGRIVVKTAHLADKQRVEISVEDTGTGIRDSDGSLMNQDSLGDIFRLGFSTKANQEGEGLGLNWVQTIVREFHGGEVVAMNVPTGGARFIIRIPLVPADAQEDHTITNQTPVEV